MPSTITVRILLVAGGGGGGAYQRNDGTSSLYAGHGGGGAGGYLSIQSAELTPGTYQVLVGKGGSGLGTQKFTSQPTTHNGIDSKIQKDGSILYACKGGGGGGVSDFSANGGGSGGGAGGEEHNSGTKGSAISNTAGYSNCLGNDGGEARNFGSTGGGGGAGSIGGTGTEDGVQNTWDEDCAGKGGDAVSNDITGSPQAYAGGGEGGSWQCFSTRGAGKVAIGGVDVVVGGYMHQASMDGRSQHGSPDTGSGGGAAGSRSNLAGGNGASGVVIIRYTKT